MRASQWSQQDGATPHTAKETLAWLRQMFEERLICRRCDVEWAPHSPDLNPQIFICRVSSQTMYTWEISQTIEELKTAITSNIRSIPKDECVKVIGNLDEFSRKLRSFSCASFFLAFLDLG